MKLSRMKIFAGAAVTFALCGAPTMATAATAQTMNPLIAVSVFGTQASAAAACNPTAAAAAAGAAVAAQGQPGCVLPATDAAPPPLPEQAAVIPASVGGGIGIAPIILGLLGIAALAALIASSGGGGGNNSPSSPS